MENSFNTKDAKTFMDRGKEYAAKGDVEQAIDEYTKAIEADPSCADAYFQRGLLYGDTDAFMTIKAINDFSETIELDGRYANAYIQRGIRYLRVFYEARQASRDFNQAVLISYENSNNTGETPHPDGIYANDVDSKDIEVFLYRAYFHLKRDAIAQAMRDIDSYIEVNSKNDIAYILRGALYLMDKQYQTADEYYADELKEKQFDKAIENFTEAIKINPDRFISYYLRGKAYGDKCRYASEEDDYVVALSKELDTDWLLSDILKDTLSKIEEFMTIVEIFDTERKIQIRLADYFAKEWIAYFNSKVDEMDKRKEDLTKRVETGEITQAQSNSIFRLYQLRRYKGGGFSNEHDRIIFNLHQAIRCSSESYNEDKEARKYTENKLEIKTDDDSIFTFTAKTRWECTRQEKWYPLYELNVAGTKISAGYVVLSEYWGQCNRRVY